MSPIEPLGLSAKQWQFLKNPDKYREASKGSDRELAAESTSRQFLTARDILARLYGTQGEKARRGILLADDVGLGKTTVAALVAWVVACAGGQGKVRILAPNDVVRRSWVKELRAHVELLKKCAPTLEVGEKRVKDGKGKLRSGSIQILNFSSIKVCNLACDLLIVDEAHRAKGEGGEFSKRLVRMSKHARRVLILTATPFSIHLAELNRMLKLIGADQAAHHAVTAFDKALNKFYSGNIVGDVEVAAKNLARKAEGAVDALRTFVIRHGVDDLPREQKSFGGYENWPIGVPTANHDELELLMRMDRALRVEKDGGSESSKATNDARFHVGRLHFDAERENLDARTQQLAEPAKSVVADHLKSIKRLRQKVGIHPKMKAVADAVKSVIEQGEKAVLFCDHHATAEELTLHLASELPKVAAPQSPGSSAWEKAWDEVLGPAGEVRHAETLRKTFVQWLCADLIRAQTWNWLRAAGASALEVNLADALKRTSARHPRNHETIAKAAQRLYHELIKSSSSRAVLRAAENRLKPLPGANGASRVLGFCDPSANRKDKLPFRHNQQPDTVISIFNSPFGPDVLVVTDRLSEGIDLHRYCRHLIHYELDPSPIRTVQRNGRLRRVNSWAAAIGEPILYAYPAFRGTRDEKLVQIMTRRIANFSLLLGGVHDIKGEDVAGPNDAEDLRDQVIEQAKKSLAAAGGQLRAREPGSLPCV